MADLQEEDFVTELSSQESFEPGGSTTVYGFVGRGPTGDTWRLYTTPALADHIELRAEDVLHYQKVTKPSSPIPGTMLWVKKGAPVKRVSYTEADPSLESTAAFLQGDILEALRSADFGVFNRPNPGPGTIIVGTVVITIVLTITSAPCVLTATATASPPTVFEE